MTTFHTQVHTFTRTYTHEHIHKQARTHHNATPKHISTQEHTKKYMYIHTVKFNSKLQIEINTLRAIIAQRGNAHYAELFCTRAIAQCAYA